VPFFAIAAFAFGPGTHVLPCAVYPLGQMPFFAIGITGIDISYLLSAICKFLPKKKFGVKQPYAA
jgi:hypothetical protein